MGRSVSHHRYAVHKAYVDVSHMDTFDWNDYLIELRAQAAKLWPSMYECDKWDDREDHIIMQNNYALFGISEYCGLACIWLAENGQIETGDMQARADHWLKQVEKKFHANFGELEKLGSMSNGEGVYKRKAA